MDAIPDWFEGALSRLENVRHVKENSIRANCPLCGGHKLTVTYRDEKIILKCWHHCDSAAVLEHWGIGFQDLYPPEQRYSNQVSEPERHAFSEALKIQKLNVICSEALHFETQKVRFYMGVESNGEDLTAHQHGEYATAVKRLLMAKGLMPWQPESAVWHYRADIGALIKARTLQDHAHQCAQVTANAKTRQEFEVEAIWAMRSSPFQKVRDYADS